MKGKRRQTQTATVRRQKVGDRPQRQLGLARCHVTSTAARRELLAAGRHFSAEACEKIVSFVMGKLSFKTRGSFKLIAVVTLTRMALVFSIILLVLACVKGDFNINANKNIFASEFDRTFALD